MGVFEHFPYTNFHDLNLDWIIEKMKEVLAETDDLDAWKTTHEQEYQILADKVDGLIHNLVDVISPWDPSIEYHIFSIVEYLGNNYIAVQDVPVGANITDTTYWQQANTVIQQINAMAVIVSNLEAWKPYITPEEYGAVGDGTNDDTGAIVNAVQASLTLGKPLVMVHTYLTDTIELKADNMQLYCYGEIKYLGTGYAVIVSGQFSRIMINSLNARYGSGMLITPDGKPAYMLDINIGILRGFNYGIKLKDYVDPLDPSHRYGVLYNKIKCKRIRVDTTSGHAIDFESDYFIGETDLDIELVDYAQWAIYAVCNGDAINAIRTSLLAMEGDLDCIYLDNVRSSVFNGLRYGETVDVYGRQFLTMTGNCFANQFNSPTQLKLSKVDVTGVTATQYNQLNMPLMNDSGRLIGLGAKVNQYGVKFISGYPSTVTIGSSAPWDYYPDTFNGVRPTQFNINKANSSPDTLKIYLDHSYCWDGINRITLLMNGANYRPVIYNTAGNVLYDFTTLAGSQYNGIYEMIFNRASDTTQTVTIAKLEYAAVVGSQPL